MTVRANITGAAQPVHTAPASGAAQTGENGGRITFSETTPCPPQKIAALLGNARQNLRMENSLTLRIGQAPEDEGERLAFAEKLLAELGE